MVVHHDQLKHNFTPFQEREPVCPSREVGEFKVVDVTPSHDGIDSVGLTPWQKGQLPTGPVHLGAPHFAQFYFFGTWLDEKVHQKTKSPKASRPQEASLLQEVKPNK